MSEFFGNILSTMSEEDIAKTENLIGYFIDPTTMKALMYNCLRIDVPDNNAKASIVRHILGNSFQELGTGTNRIAFRKNGVVIKVALDRRGLVDNFTEFKRSSELDAFLAKTYETNYLINICEYIEVMDQDTFYYNEAQIKEVLSRMSENYLFDDIGFTEKNSYNWGRRESRLNDDEKALYGDLADDMYDVVILDYGYLYPLHDQKKSLLRCPRCQHQLIWNGAYTGLMCKNSQCNFQTTPMQLRSHMKLDYEDLENKLISSFNNLQMPDLTSIEREITKINAQRKEDDE